MSAETIEWLNENVLVGYTDTNGKAWHATDTAASIENHFAAEVPLERVTDLLGFPVTQEPLQHVGAGGFVASDAHSVIYRPDNGRVFSVMSSGYQIHPYVETLLDGLNGVLATDELKIGSAGLLRGGARAWVQVNAPETLQVGGDTLLPFVTASTSLDGSQSTRFTLGAQRAVCDNTLDMSFMFASGTYSLRHTRHSLAAFNPETVADTIGVLADVSASLDLRVDMFLDTTVSEAQWAAIAADLAGIDPDMEPGRGRSIAETKESALWEAWNADMDAQYAGTAWGALQAVNTYWNHSRPLRNMSGTSRYERNYEALIAGDTRKNDSDAVAALLRHTDLVLA